MREIDGKLPGEIHSTCGGVGSKASNALCLCANDHQQIKFHISLSLPLLLRERRRGDESRRKRCRRRRLHFVFAEPCFTFKSVLRRTQPAREREWRKGHIHGNALAGCMLKPSGPAHVFPRRAHTKRARFE